MTHSMKKKKKQGSLFKSMGCSLFNHLQIDCIYIFHVLVDDSRLNVTIEWT